MRVTTTTILNLEAQSSKVCRVFGGSNAQGMWLSAGWPYVRLQSGVGVLSEMLRFVRGSHGNIQPDVPALQKCVDAGREKPHVRDFS